MSNNYLIASQHALYRYIERVLCFDFTELKINYMIEKGLPSLNYIKDAHFLRWCEDTIGGFGEFRQKMVMHVWNLLSDKQKNIVKNNKNFESERVKDVKNGITFIVSDNTIVTVLN